MLTQGKNWCCWKLERVFKCLDYRLVAIRTMNNHFSPFPTLRTKRLHLRELMPDDDHEIFLQRSNPQLQEFVDVVDPQSLEYAQYFIRKIADSVAEGSCIYWAITLENSPKLIGTICLWNLSVENATAEFGYALHPDFQGQGYMQEAIETVEEYGFEVMQAKRIVAYPHVKNKPSIRLLERNHYVRTGEADEHAVFTKSREEFECLSA